MKTVSAVVTAHKDLKQLSLCLKSLTEQSKVPDEIILCISDMPIPDESYDMLVLDKNRDDWGHNKRDMGLRLATKDYVWFVNADDEYSDTFLEKLLERDEDLIYCDFETHLNGRVIESYPSLGTISSGNFIVKRELGQKVGWNHRHYEADGQFIMDVMQELPTYYHVPEVLYFHR